jgi:hypothetical protein
MCKYMYVYMYVYAHNHFIFYITLFSFVFFSINRKMINLFSKELSPVAHEDTN